MVFVKILYYFKYMRIGSYAENKIRIHMEAKNKSSRVDINCLPSGFSFVLLIPIHVRFHEHLFWPQLQWAH